MDSCRSPGYNATPDPPPRCRPRTKSRRSAAPPPRSRSAPRWPPPPAHSPTHRRAGPRTPDPRAHPAHPPHTRRWRPPPPRRPPARGHATALRETLALAGDVLRCVGRFSKVSGVDPMRPDQLAGTESEEAMPRSYLAATEILDGVLLVCGTVSVRVE